MNQQIIHIIKSCVFAKYHFVLMLFVLIFFNQNESIGQNLPSDIELKNQVKAKALDEKNGKVLELEKA